MEEFLRIMAGEAAEQAMHEAIANGMHEAHARGESQKEVAKSGLRAVLAHGSPMMRFAQTHSWSIPWVMRAIGVAFKRADFVDKLLPGDDRFREARFLMKEVAPHLIIGTGSGMREALSKVDETLDATRSDTGVPTDAQNKSVDWVVVSSEMPGRFFVPSRDSAGNIRREGDPASGVPIVNHRDWGMVKAVWDRTHKATTRQVGGGRGAPPRTERVQAEPFPFQILTLPEALSQAGEAMSASDVEAIKAMLKKPASWGATLTDRAKDVLLALATTRARKSALSQTLTEDFFKDLPGKGDVALIEHLAQKMHSRIGDDGTLSDENFDAAVSHIDSFLGGELTFKNKARRALDRFMNSGTRTGGLIRALVHSSAYAGFVFLLVQFMIFMVAFFFMLQSLLFGMGEYHRKQAIVSATVLIIMLFTLRIWQLAFKPLAVGILNMQQEWLAEFGWRFTGMLMPVYLIAIGMTPGIDTSFTARWIILALAFVGVCIGMLYRVGEVPAQAQMLVIRGAQYGWIVVIGIMGLDYAFRQAWHVLAANKIPGALDAVQKYLSSHQWVASAVLFTLIFVPGVLLARRIAQTRNRKGSELEITQDGYFLGGLFAFVIALVIAVSVPWFGTVQHIKDPFSPTPKVTETRSDHSKKSDVDDRFNCSVLNPRQRRLAGCP